MIKAIIDTAERCTLINQDLSQYCYENGKGNNYCVPITNESDNECLIIIQSFILDYATSKYNVLDYDITDSKFFNQEI